MRNGFFIFQLKPVQFTLRNLLSDKHQNLIDFKSGLVYRAFSSKSLCQIAGTNWHKLTQAPNRALFIRVLSDFAGRDKVPRVQQRTAALISNADNAGFLPY
jgi:hypothetical protein